MQGKYLSIKLGKPSLDPHISSSEWKTPIWYQVRDSDKQVLSWLMRNKKGSIVLTGYRGVGKTSCMLYNLNEYEKRINRGRSGNAIEVKNIPISLSNIPTVAEFAKLLISKLIKWSEANDKFWLERKDSEQVRFIISDLRNLQQQLISHTKKNKSLKQSLAADYMGFKGSFINEDGETIDIFDLTDAEIVAQLAKHVKDLINEISKGNAKCRLIISFDEIDKVKAFQEPEEKEKNTAFEQLVGKLKVLLMDSGATFFFVAGRETFHRWLIDKTRGISVYSSIFDHIVEIEPFLEGSKVTHGNRSELEEKDPIHTINKIVDDYLRAKYCPYQVYSPPTINQFIKGQFDPDLNKCVCKYSIPRDTNDCYHKQEEEEVFLPWSIFLGKNLQRNTNTEIPIKGIDSTAPVLQGATQSEIKANWVSKVVSYLWPHRVEIKPKGVPEQITNPWCSLFSLPQDGDIIRGFLRYLLWKSKGVPRKLIHELEYFIKPSEEENKEYFLKPGEDDTEELLFTNQNVKTFKFYSGMVKELYLMVKTDHLGNDDILKMMALSEAVLKFYKTGYNYFDLKMITITVDQDVIFNHEHYHELVVRLFDSWWVEQAFGRKSQHTFQKHIKATIEYLCHHDQHEAVAFKLQKQDFSEILQYYKNLDELVDKQSETQRVHSIRIQFWLGRLYVMLGDDFKAIEYFKKAVRLGLIEIERAGRTESKINIGNIRLLTRMMAECYIDVGYIFEQKRRLRKAATFFKSAVFVIYQSEKQNKKYLNFQAPDGENLNVSNSEEEGSPKETDTNSNGPHLYAGLNKFFKIAEESIDGISNLGYMHWKMCRNKSAEYCFLQAVIWSFHRAQIHKIASQVLLLSNYYFKNCKIGEAISWLQLLLSKNGITRHEESNITPSTLIISTREALACCYISLNEKKLACDQLKKAMLLVDKHENPRKFGEIGLRLLQIQLIKVREGKATGEVFDPESKNLIRSLFSCFEDSYSLFSIKKHNVISMKLHYKFILLIAWHFLSFLGPSRKSNTDHEERARKKRAKKIGAAINELEEIFSFLTEKIIKEIEFFLKKERLDLGSVAISFGENIPNESQNGEDQNEIYPFLENKKTLLGRTDSFIKNKNVIWSIYHVQFFTEQLLALCLRGSDKVFYSYFAMEPSGRLGLFYDSICKNTEEGEITRVIRNLLRFAQKKSGKNRMKTSSEIQNWICHKTLGDSFMKYSKHEQTGYSEKQAIGAYEDAMKHLNQSLLECFDVKSIPRDEHYREQSLFNRDEAYMLAFDRLFYYRKEKLPLNTEIKEFLNLQKKKIRSIDLSKTKVKIEALANEIDWQLYDEFKLPDDFELDGEVYSGMKEETETAPKFIQILKVKLEEMQMSVKFCDSTDHCSSRAEKLQALFAEWDDK